MQLILARETQAYQFEQKDSLLKATIALKLQEAIINMCLRLL